MTAAEIERRGYRSVIDVLKDLADFKEFSGQGATVTPTLVPRSASVNPVWRPRP